MEINELKDKVLAALGQATDGTRDLAGKTVGGAKSIAGAVGEKVKSGGRIAKLSMEAASAREELKKTYLEIGRLYYDTHKDDPEGFFVQLFEEIRTTEESVAAKEAELAELKAALKESLPSVTVEIVKDEDADGDFADIVDQAEAEAGEFREGVVEKFEDLKAAAEEKAEQLKEAAAEAREAVENASAAAREAAESLNETAKDAAEKVQEAAEEAKSEAEKSHFWE